MATEVAEPPSAVSKPEYIPPQVQKQEPLKVNRGDLFEKALAEARAEEKRTEAQETPVKPATSEPTKEEAKTEQIVQTQGDKPDVKTEEKPTEKPASPLDVVTDETKPEVPEPDVLAQFDEKTANWKEARRVMKEQSEARKALESELAKLKETPKPQPDEILALSKAKQELEERLSKQEESLKALNYQYSETFQKMVSDRDAQVTKIQARVERVGGDTEKMLAALAMPDGRPKNAAIKEALAEVDAEDRTRIHTLLEGLDEKNEKLAEEAKNSSSRWDELTTKRQAELAEEQANGLKTLESEFTRIAAELPTEIPTLRTVPDDVDGASEWNEAIKKAHADALRVLTPGGSDAKESMRVAIEGAHYPFLMQYVLKQNATIKDQAKRLAEYDSGGPDFKGSPKPAGKVALEPAAKYHQALASIKSSSDTD